MQGKVVGSLGAMLLLSGCVSPIANLSMEQRNAVADVRFYDNAGVPPSAYEVKGPLQAKTFRANTPLARSHLLDEMRVQAAALGADGIIRFVCDTSFYPGPIYVTECTGTAVKLKSPTTASSGGGTGSGFFVNARGDLVTNAHVTRGCEKVTVMVNGQEVPGTVAFSDAKTDLSLVRTGWTPPSFVPVRIAPPIKLAEPVIAIGYPLSGLLSKQVHVTDGSVTALAGLRDDTSRIQISAPITNGNSGGPLVDLSGHLVGVNTSGMDVRLAQNTNFAVRTTAVMTFLDTAGAEYLPVTSKDPLAKTAVAEKATAFTAQVSCRPKS
jgi:S1-C subfamily serine protease